MSIEKFEHPLIKLLNSNEKCFILCSTSPRRIEILKNMGFNRIVIKPSEFPEDLDKSLFTPQEYVENTAEGKALNVYESLKKEYDLNKEVAKEANQFSKICLLAADTVIETNGKIFEKPKDIEDQYNSLRQLRDSKAKINCITGVVIITNEYKDDNEGIVKMNKLKFSVITEIEFNGNCSDELIRNYCNCKEGLKVAGGFKIQGYGSILIKKINGDYHNVVGLPFTKTFENLCKINNINF
ncbi:hypothetical protein BVG19_g500 [[Candida] boidinii]|nr:hypothetical protein BVG19_g500 [[Candida] boidinii]OWB48527.1 hypothetical protein B5S27_g62 [[Candida] boidinii]